MAKIGDPAVISSLMFTLYNMTIFPFDRYPAEFVTLLKDGALQPVCLSFGHRQGGDDLFVSRTHYIKRQHEDQFRLDLYGIRVDGEVSMTTILGGTFAVAHVEIDITQYGETLETKITIEVDLWKRPCGHPGGLTRLVA